MNCYLKTVGTSIVASLALAGLLIPVGLANRNREPAARGRKVDELFNKNCARCHGADGRGDTPSGHLFRSPDFTDPQWWKTNSSLTSTRSLRTIVRRGKGSMPAFGRKLTRSEINLLVNRIRSFRKLERKN